MSKNSIDDSEFFKKTNRIWEKYLKEQEEFKKEFEKKKRNKNKNMVSVEYISLSLKYTIHKMYWLEKYSNHYFPSFKEYLFLFKH